MILRRTMIKFCLISKINESNSMEAIDKTIFSEETKFWLSEIIGIENYFIKRLITENYVVKN